MIKYSVEYQEDGEMKLQMIEPLVLSQQELLRVLLSTYMTLAEDVVKTHKDECSDPDCCVVEMSQEVLDAIRVTIELHNSFHGHKHEQE